MRFPISRFIVAVSALAMLAGGAQAQGIGGGGGRGRHQQKTDKTESQKPKPDDKAYNAAIKTLPDKPYDPWHGSR